MIFFLTFHLRPLRCWNRCHIYFMKIYLSCQPSSGIKGDEAFYNTCLYNLYSKPGTNYLNWQCKPRKGTMFDKETSIQKLELLISQFYGSLYQLYPCWWIGIELYSSYHDELSSDPQTNVVKKKLKKVFLLTLSTISAEKSFFKLNSLHIYQRQRRRVVSIKRITRNE